MKPKKGPKDGAGLQSGPNDFSLPEGNGPPPAHHTFMAADRTAMPKAPDIKSGLKKHLDTLDSP